MIKIILLLLLTAQAYARQDNHCVEALVAKTKMSTERFNLNLMRCSNVLLAGETKFLYVKKDMTTLMQAQGIESYNSCAYIAYIAHQFETNCEQTKERLP